MEDYKKKYDELLLKLQKAKVDDNVCDEMYYRVIDNIVPELKESEDERIRKWLIDTIKAVPNDSIEWEKIDKSDFIAWLKKQGEQKQDPCEHCDDKRLNCHNFPCVKKRAFKQGKSVFDVINEEKVDNTNKVEPKSEFKVGDWIVHNSSNNLYKIVSFDSGYCSLIDIEGTYYNPCICPNGDYHLWNLSDVKNGGILYSSSLHLIWIYKDNETAHICVNMNYVKDNVFTEGLIVIPEDACPATKEQREQLEKAMADAGYTFDFEKKELKKIGDEIEIPFGAKDSELQEATYYIPKGFHAEIDKDKVVIKKGEKPIEWSEEDENLLKLSFENLTELKDRYGVDYGKVWKCINWLKSLKERCIWKPSDEQMEALEHFVRSVGESGYASPYDNNTKLLYSILSDLKKLKG